MRTTLEHLTKRIEQVIHEHMTESQLAAAQAVARAFVAHDRARRLGPSTRPTMSKGRRAESEIAALTERLYETVCRKPGELMVVLAAELSSSAAELQMPMRRLRNDERVRSIGARHQTRYFPLAKP